MLCTVILLSVLTASVSGQCPSYKPIPDIHRRGANYTLASGESPINDRDIIEGWYGTPGYILVSEAPGFFKCGGWYPLWRRETNGGRAVLCIETGTNKCSATIEINVATCDGTEIYELKEVTIHRASYCFEEFEEDAPDVQIVSSVEVNQTHTLHKSSYVFRCEFTRPDASLFYKTFWYVNGELKYDDFDAMQWGVDYIGENALTEDILKEKGITKAGFNLQCAVRAQTTKTGKLSQGDLSENLFVGVEVQAWTSWRLKEGASRDINLRVDIPFGCGQFLPSINEACLMNVEVITIQNKEICAEAAVVQKSCKIEALTEGRWSKVTVTGKVTSTDGVSSGVSHLKLKTSKDQVQLSSLWNDYEIGTFPIQIIKSTTATQFITCWSRNDPYVWTFDELDFGLGEGEFVLYEDADIIEVQIKTEDCGEYNVDDGPYCTCGVAVRAGRTVFEISHCESPVWHIGFSACGDTGEVLNVVRYRYDHYVIHLPSGLRVDVHLSGSEPHLVNVYVYPTVKDVGKSRGMCGTLSSKADKSQTTINERIEQSRVNDETKNLFNPGITLSSYKPLYQYCTCITENNKKSLECSPMTASEVCLSPEYQTTVTPKECVISKRKKRMAQFYERNKRSVETDVSSWNESLARDYCNKEFEKSNTVQIVKDVTGVNVDDSIQNCVDDILKSRTTDFTKMAIDSIRVLAMVQAMKNLNLSIPMQDDPQGRSMFKLITEHTCQGDCSGKGMCIKGVCQCNAGYGGGDCSVDLSVPPVVYDVGGSLCDLSGTNCSKTAVIGNIFSGEKEAKCRIEKQKIGPNGEIQTGSVHLTPAVAESISEVECQLPEAEDDDVAITYHISVSQSAEIFSNKLSILVYDSSCVTMNQETHVWEKKNDTCTYKGKCSNIGDSRGDNPCLTCEINGGVARWTSKAGNGCSKEDFTIDYKKSSQSTASIPSSFLVAASALVLRMI